MSFKGTMVGVATVAGLATGAMYYAQPHSIHENDQQQHQTQQDQLSDSQERSNETKRRQGTDGMDADRIDRLHPGEHRPPPGKIRIRP